MLAHFMDKRKDGDPPPPEMIPQIVEFYHSVMTNATLFDEAFLEHFPRDPNGPAPFTPTLDAGDFLKAYVARENPYNHLRALVPSFTCHTPEESERFLFTSTNAWSRLGEKERRRAVPINLALINAVDEVVQAEWDRKGKSLLDERGFPRKPLEVFSDLRDIIQRIQQIRGSGNTNQ